MNVIKIKRYAIRDNDGRFFNGDALEIDLNNDAWTMDENEAIFYDHDEALEWAEAIGLTEENLHEWEYERWENFDDHYGDLRDEIFKKIRRVENCLVAPTNIEASHIRTLQHVVHKLAEIEQFLGY